MRSKVLRLLWMDGGYLSGEAISEEVWISRAGVWKHIKALQDDGCIIEASTNKGYKLVSLPDLLKPEYINLYLEAPREDIFWMAELDSTNNYCKKLAADGHAGAIAVAESQTLGKGRLGRNWESAAGQSVTLSIMLRPKMQPRQAPLFNFAAALAVCDAVMQVTGIAPAIKWPNDVVVKGKKLCGILTEMSADTDRIEYLICGVGINVNQEVFPGELAQKAVSLRMLTKEKTNRLWLAAILIESLYKRFSQLETEGSVSLMEEYRKKSAILGKEVIVATADSEKSGTCVGFGDNGELILDNNGERQTFFAGEVSVRGAKDYV